MSQFQFRLDSVIRLRERERDEAAHALQQAQLAVQKLDVQITERRNEYDAQHPVQRASNQSDVNPQRLLESQRFQMVLLQEIRQLLSNRQLVAEECERRRATLVQHEQKVRSLEKLKEKQRLEWEATELKRGQIALDQWAGFRYWQTQETKSRESPAN